LWINVFNIYGKK